MMCLIILVIPFYHNNYFLYILTLFLSGSSTSTNTCRLHIYTTQIKSIFILSENCSLITPLYSKTFLSKVLKFQKYGYLRLSSVNL